MPSTRPDELSGTWYPGRAESLTAAVEGYLSEAGPSGDGPVLGGIVPHAGWAYSGPTAARTFAAVGDPTPRAFVLLGVSHRRRIDRAALSPHGAWRTPAGDVAVDRELAEILLGRAAEWMDVREGPHAAGENSLEVQVPFVATMFPGAAIVPIAVPPEPLAVELGRCIGAALAEVGERVVVIGSTDLTHYGMGHYGFAPHGTGLEAHRWAKEVNDRSFIDKILSLDAEGALDDARRRHNACGSGPAAAAVAAAREMGAETARLLAHTTSWEASREGSEPSQFVGYASIVFSGPPPSGTR